VARNDSLEALSDEEAEEVLRAARRVSEIPRLHLACPHRVVAGCDLSWDRSAPTRGYVPTPFTMSDTNLREYYFYEVRRIRKGLGEFLA